MSISNNFPSRHTGLQQSFFRKVAQSDFHKKRKRILAGKDFGEQKTRSVSVLDARLRSKANIYLSDTASSIDVIVEKLKMDARQVANELCETATKLCNDKLINADKFKQKMLLGSKEKSVISAWGALNTRRLNVLFQDEGKPVTFEECVDQAIKSRQKMIELGDPSQYGSGRLGRSAREVIKGMLRGIYSPIKYYFLFSVGFPFVLVSGAGFEASCAAAIIVAAIVPIIFAGVAWGISEGTGISFDSVLLTLIGLIFGVSVVMGGLGLFSSEEEDAERKVRSEKRSKLIEGYAAYLIFRRAEDLIQGLYATRVKALEDEKNTGYENAKQQEVELLTSIDDFSAELGKAEHSFQLTMQTIETEFQEEQKGLKQEFKKVLEELTGYSKPAISAWNDGFWQTNVAEFSAAINLLITNKSREIRIGRTIIPGTNHNKDTLPMLIDLSKCGHVFILTTKDREEQATKLLKAITARIVFTSPIMRAKFMFIDTKAAGVFAEYHHLPEKMGNRIYSSSRDILEQTGTLEQHQKMMQAKVGNSNLETYNLTAEEPEKQRVVCISGFPGRFEVEAESYLENIIQSGARVGIHVVLKAYKDSGESNTVSKLISWELCSKHGVILQPSNHPDQWEVCFNGLAFPFVPDSAPDSTIIENRIRQIHDLAKPKTIDRPMQVFLCHASEDKVLVREVYQKLKDENWIRPWLDKEFLLPGQDWDLEIRQAIENSGAVIIFLSNNSVTKEGYVQKEIKKVLDIAEEKPEGTIFIIPFRLDECDLPRGLRKMQWVDYFPPEQHEDAFQQLLRALKIRYERRSSN